MADNIFAPDRQAVSDKKITRPPQEKVYSSLPDYSLPPMGKGFTVCSFGMGFVLGFVIFYVFYKSIIASVVGGTVLGVISIFMRQNSAVAKRKLKLRVQFLDMLEAMSVSLRAGNPTAKALVSARDDLLLTYSEKSDIVVELNAILKKFQNAIPISEGFSDFAKRSGLDDIASFATVYATIEGKSSRSDEIVRETQRVIADKMTIEMEIDTMMTAAKNEVSIMLMMPLVVLLIMGYAGSGFMDKIYTTPAGRVVATVGLVMYGISYLLAQKFSNIKL